MTLPMTTCWAFCRAAGVAMHNSQQVAVEIDYYAILQSLPVEQRRLVIAQARLLADFGSRNGLKNAVKCP